MSASCRQDGDPVERADAHCVGSWDHHFVLQVPLSLPLRQWGWEGKVPAEGSAGLCAHTQLQKLCLGLPKAKAPKLALLLPPHTPLHRAGSCPWLGAAPGKRRDAGREAGWCCQQSWRGSYQCNTEPAIHINFILSHFDFLWV